MKHFVIDASVIVKWIFHDQPGENHAGEALHLLKAIKQDLVKVLQPTHWIPEVMSVIVRKDPETAESALNFLYGMELSEVNTIEVYNTACYLSQKLEHHLFDTLYHAVALCQGARLITADDVYYRKAHKQGSIVRLADFSVFDD